MVRWMGDRDPLTVRPTKYSPLSRTQLSFIETEFSLMIIDKLKEKNKATDDDDYAPSFTSFFTAATGGGGIKPTSLRYRVTTNFFFVACTIFARSFS